ncbi:MAG: TIGR02996 domain-containing protein [Planctomycetales bacterium]
MSHECFLAEILEHPGDAACRLVYADWLEEQGDRRADFIRLVVEGESGAPASAEAIREVIGLEPLGEDHPSDGLFRNLWEWLTLPSYSLIVRAAGLSDELWPLFAADCAERALPIFEKAFPDDDRPRQAIEAARNSAPDVGDASWAAWESADMVVSPLEAEWAAESASHAAAAAHAETSPANAAAAAAFNASCALGANPDKEAELCWQLVRLGEYKLWGRAVGLWIPGLE